MKKILLTTLATASLLGGGAIVYKDAFADSESNSYPPFVQELAERFSLDAGEVGEYMADQKEQKRAEHQEQIQEQFEERLEQAVIDGTITDQQSAAIQAKRAENQEERSQHREEHHAEMEAWAESIGLNLEDLHGLMGPKGHKGIGRLGGWN